MPTLSENLEIDRCPHCSIDHPNLRTVHHFVTVDHKGQNQRSWRVYKCIRCGGAAIAYSTALERNVIACYPSSKEIDLAIPVPARDYLKQAINSIHAPAGAAMLSASAVDSMLKIKGYKKGTLNARIDKAAEDHVITSDMAKWAHHIRLDANEPRHADEVAPLPDEESARLTVEFAQALGQFLFVLPARVRKGLEQTESTDSQ